MSILDCTDLRVTFGTITAVDDISISIDEGEWVSIVGPNGAGKTSLFNLINGFYTPDSGTVTFDGEDITWFPPWKRARRGLARTFQKETVFAEETVVDNLATVRGVSHRSSLLESLLWLGPGRRAEVETHEDVEELVDFLELEEHRHTQVAGLPLEAQRRVSLGRALALDPDVILLDEIMSGLTFDEKYNVARFITDIWNERDVAIVMIEHDLEVVTSITNRMIVLNEGRVLADGDPTEVAAREDVKRVYSGGAE
jgi:branched-chain amino acid transport system ATP-binding protein